jgi:c-di-GMP phosphodiesterase
LENIYVGIQPIFDRNLEVYAYEVLYRGRHAPGAAAFDGNQATSEVLINTFLEFGIENVTDGRPAFFNMTREFLLRDELPLPCDGVVLEVLEDIEVNDEIIEAIRRHARHGFRIALDDYTFDIRWDPLLKLADFIKVDVLALGQEALATHMPRLKGLKARLLAEKVETHEMFEFLKGQGFDLFQGYFFCKPRVIEGKRVSPTQNTLFAILAELQRPELSISELERILSSDPTLGFKLLKYLNSPVFGIVGEKLQSLRQAIIYLGPRHLQNWASLLLVGAFKGKSSELARLSMCRARQCEQFGIRCHTASKREAFFIAGLFSLLDALMGIPLEDILTALPVSEEIKLGISDRAGAIGEVLEAVVALEEGNPAPAEALSRNVPDLNVSEICLESIHWANEQINAIEGL